MFENKKASIKYGIIFASLLLVFIIYTILVKFVDTSAIAPDGSLVGFATLNKAVKDAIGLNETMYKIGDYISILPLGLVLLFAMVGLVQWIKRKNILKVDLNILALGIFYLLVLFTFILFEIISLNKRPFILDGKVETSYPSSTTMMALSVMITAIDQTIKYVKNKKLAIGLIVFELVFCVFLLISRVIAGVHWISDIIGGAIISICLLFFYYSIKNFFIYLATRKKENAENKQ